MGADAEAAAAIARCRDLLLEPAGLTPLGVERGPLEARVDGLAGTATLVRPEEAAWNRAGPEGLPLLFNDRAALLVEVDLRAPGARWAPERTWVEVNRPEHRIPAARDAEEILGPLTWCALEQERLGLDGDLVQRTRYAGGFREAWIRADGDALRGLIAFPLPDPDVHVGALRLTVGVSVEELPRELVWVFQ